jgi:hypothetical protein
MAITTADRTALLAPLGHSRLRLLDCLGGNSEWAPGYFRVESDDDVFATFRTYATALSRAWAEERDPAVVALLAAARVLTGDWAAAHVIVDRLPTAAIKLDHGAGFCRVVPFRALASALPLPAALRDSTRWLAGSSEQTALRTWLTEHGEHLRWLEESGVYKLAA